MKKALKKYKVFFVNHIHHDLVVEAESEHDAMVEGLIEYRRNYGFIETVHLWPLEKIVERAECME